MSGIAKSIPRSDHGPDQNLATINLCQAKFFKISAVVAQK